MFRIKPDQIKLTLVLILVIAGFLSLIRETYLANSGVVLAASSAGETGIADFRDTGLLPLNLPLAQVSNEPPTDFTVRVPVLMYHYIRDGVSPAHAVSYMLTVTPGNLDQQFAWLAQNGYQTLSLNDIYESLTNQTPLPAKSVVLTFDDGYRDFYTNAFPLLKKYNLRAVSFYIAGYTNYPEYMDWSMLHEIHNSGLVDVENHTLHHFDLTKLNLTTAWHEIADSKKLLEQGLSKKIYYFDYPYGSLNYQIIDLVKAAGYKLAFSTRVGTVLRSNETWFLKRIGIVGSDNLASFVNKVVNLVN